MDLTAAKPQPAPAAAAAPILSSSDLTAQIESAFSYHPPKGDQPRRYELIRAEAKNLAFLINSSCPHSRERSLALTQLEMCVAWANASIARHE